MTTKGGFFAVSRAQLGDRDLEVAEQLEEEGLELLVGAIDLVDQEHRRHGIGVVDRVKQGPAEEELGAEDLLLGLGPVRALAEEPDVEQLAGVVPLVGRVCEVDALVALEADQAGAEHVGHDLGRLGLADPGLPLDEERFAELERQVDRGCERPVADVAALGQLGEDLVDGLDFRHWLPNRSVPIMGGRPIELEEVAARLAPATAEARRRVAARRPTAARARRSARRCPARAVRSRSS